jgi:replicative DNA helicase
LEMSGIDTMDRLISMRCDIPTSDLYMPGDASRSILERIEVERQELSKNNKFYFVEDPDIDIARLQAIIKEFKQRSKEGYFVLVIDLITQLRDFLSPKSGVSVASAIESAMNLLNAVAKKEGIHIVGIVQFNREADSARIHSMDDIDELRPNLNHIKNSHAIAERSRQVVSVFREKYYAERYLPEDEQLEYMDDILDITVLKQSNGRVGQRLPYMFEGEVFRCIPRTATMEEQASAEAQELQEANNHLSY